MNVDLAKKNNWSAKQWAGAKIILLEKELEDARSEINFYSGPSEFGAVRIKEQDLRLSKLSYHEQFGETFTKE